MTLPSGARALLFSLILLALPLGAMATEEYARQTGQPCKTCHIDPAGGGELTAAGVGFQKSGTLATSPAAAPAPATAPERSAASRLFRLVAGYLHLITAILWFGTILYVHLVLKPAYAASGLPRGEMRVGLASMATMAVTGAILTHYRVPDPALILTTRFGILLTIKVSLFAIMVISALYVVTVIGPKLRRQIRNGGTPAATGGDMTMEVLGGFDGKEGRPTYVAYQGGIYDVTESRLWKEGSHMRRHQAGIDLTEALSQAPHGEDRVLAMPRIGDLVTESVKVKQPLHVRVFYFMAYMNLTMVFLITLVVALWRWW
ncbi:MAG: cytochrome B5 [Geobacter sp.]|nr:MAG: cytochrome B5 [Geobacter sp.]